MNPLNSVSGAITTGFIVAVIVIVIIAALGMGPGTFHELGLARWLHISERHHVDRAALLLQSGADSGLAAATADKGGPGGAGITKYIAPRALCGFAGARWRPG